MWIGLSEQLLLLLLVVGFGCCSRAASPPISARVQANWPAPPLAVQYLEALALEDSASLWPVLHHLTHVRNPQAHKDKRFAKLSDQGKAILGANEDSSNSIPLFNPMLPHQDFNDAFDTIMWGVLGQKGGKFNQSMHMSIAARETSALIEGMRQIELHRSQELGNAQLDENSIEPSRTCSNWIDVGNARLCNEAQFWAYFGQEQKGARVPLRLANA